MWSALAKVLPSPHQPLRHFFGIQCEDQLITPVAIDVQIARPKTLGPEAQLRYHAKALGVLRSDCDLDAMQRHDLEAVINGQGHSSWDDAAPRQLLVDPIANLTPGRRATNDPAHGQLAPQSGPRPVRFIVVKHQPRQHPSLPGLAAQRSDQSRVRRWADL